MNPITSNIPILGSTSVGPVGGTAGSGAPASPNVLAADAFEAAVSQALAEVATAFSALLPRSLQQRTFPIESGSFVLPRFGANGQDLAYPAPGLNGRCIVQDPILGSYHLVSQSRPNAVTMDLAPLQNRGAVAPAAAPGFQSTGGTDKKTGLPKSGTLTPDASGDMNIPGIGRCRLESYVDKKGRTRERVVGADGKVLKEGIKPGAKFSLKIPGTKYKYELRPQPDGSFQVKLKKPGFWSSLVGVLQKILPIISTILSFMPPPFCVIGLALRLASAALNVEEGIRNGNWKQAVVGAGAAFAGAAGAFAGGSELAQVADTVNDGAKLAVAADNVRTQGLRGAVSAASSGLTFGADLSSSLGNEALATQLTEAKDDLKVPLTRYIKA
jgi:hypothetical protein